MNPFQQFSQPQRLTNIINSNNNTHVSVITTSAAPLKRTRAKRSCDFCRKRKSRCDADTCTPCSNCKAWGYTCQFQTIRKKRGPPSVYVDNLEKKCKKMESLLTALTNCSIEHLERNDFQYAGHVQSNSPPVQTDSSSDEDEETDFDTYTREQEINKDYDSIKYTGQSFAGLRLFDNAFKSQSSIPWPGRENIVLKLVSQDELMIIRTEKSSMTGKSDMLLDVGLSMRIPLSSNSTQFDPTPLKNTKKPASHQLDEMIGMYFSHLHVSLPIINKTKFLNQYNHSSISHSILTQAVFALTFRFASQNSPGLVKDAGEFGDGYFRKVIKQLRDSSRPRLCYVQATLLIVLYLDMDEGDTESMQWITLGSAIRMAQDLGLHRSCSNWDLPRSEIETRHRVFYACYIMDRWLGACTGKPLTILDRDFDTDIPSPFEITDDDSGEDQPIYQFFVLFIELSEILGRVLKSLYAPNAKNANSFAALDDTTILSVLDSRLKTLKTLMDKSTDGIYLTKLDNLNLKIYYFTVILLLHRPFSGLSTKKGAQSHSIVSESEKICTDAAKELGEVVTKRQSENSNPAYYSIFCSPSFFIYALFQCSLVFLSNALKTRSSSDIQVLYQSIHLIKNHHDMGSAPRAIEILNMLASINGLCPDTNNRNLSTMQQEKSSCSTSPLIVSSPHNDAVKNNKTVKVEATATQCFQHQPINDSIGSEKSTDMLQSNQERSNAQNPNCQQHRSQYQSSQHHQPQQNLQQHVTQPNCYVQTYPIYNTHGYSHQRSFSLDQLNDSHQTYTQQHSRSISHDQLEMMASLSSSFPRTPSNQKLSVGMNVNNIVTNCYTPQINNSHHQQLMPPFNTSLPQAPQTYTTTPYDPNMNISNTALPPSNLNNWSDWDVYIGHQNSSHQQ